MFYLSALLANVCKNRLSTPKPYYVVFIVHTHGVVASLMSVPQHELGQFNRVTNKLAQSNRVKIYPIWPT